MDDDSVGALIGIVMSLVALGVVYAVIRAAAHGSADRNAFVGIRIKATQRSDDAWRAGHAAALPVARKALVALTVLDLVCGALLVLGPRSLTPWLGVLPAVALLLALVPITRASKKAADAAS